MGKYLTANDLSKLLSKYEHASINYEDSCCEVVGTKGNVKCPKCGESYYMEKYSMTTAAYYPPIYKDGVNINPDRNTTTTECQCLNCGKNFSYKS